MVDHQKIKAITNDIYNQFYLKIKDLDNTNENWELIVKLSDSFAEKYNYDPFCKDLIVAYAEEIDRAQKK